MFKSKSPIIVHCAKKCGLFLLIVFFAAAIGAAAGLSYAADWLSAGDRPQKADAILVLGGGYSRPFQAADLHRQGLARKIYVSVPAREDQHRLLDDAGIAFPREEEIVRQVLLKKGVPASAIEYLGKDLISTAAEAQAARALFANGTPRLLVVTSPYHLRRARMIFRDILPAADIRVIATGYDPLPQVWWKDQNAARNVLLELAKITFYQFGGRF
ncbi:MAG: YdcF family protein [Betaproteobacteria bacterium]|nr:YdcF family protein [Betaproteobacteria bacterium]